MRYLFLFIVLLPIIVHGQRPTMRSRSEFGFMFGGSNYIGDLNQFIPWYGIQPAAGLIYRFHVHSRLALRGNLFYGTVGASDKDASEPLIVNRNLSFQSTIFELAGGLEFNYFPFQLGHEKYKGTAYMLVEIGVFRMNPTTIYNDERIELQPLGTEGQGSSLNGKKNYNLVQLSIPLGIGCKVSLGKKASFSLEYGIRKTFTDYLDDVASDAYVDEVALAAENGPLAGALSNRSLDGSRYGKRGTSANKDWYSFFGAMFTFRLGKPAKCPSPY